MNSESIPFTKGRKHRKEAQENIVENSERSAVALLMIDVINELDFEGNEHIIKEAKEVGPAIQKLRARCKQEKIPVIYCQDNFGRWRSDFGAIYTHVRDSNSPGSFLAEMLEPGECDYRLIKPKHSAFYGTTLVTLLQHLGTKTLICCGFAGDVCVFFSANDAYMNDISVVVPSDCIGCTSADARHAAELLMKTVLKIKPLKSTELDLEKLLRHQDDGPGEV